jgi:hypothetical protein
MRASSSLILAADNIPFGFKAVFHEVESIPDSGFDHDVVLLVIVSTEPLSELLLIIISKSSLNSCQDILSSSKKSTSLVLSASIAICFDVRW